MNHRSHQITRNFGNGVSIERGAANPLAYSRGRDSRRIFRKPDYTVERTNASVPTWKLLRRIGVYAGTLLNYSDSASWNGSIADAVGNVRCHQLSSREEKCEMVRIVSAVFVCTVRLRSLIRNFSRFLPFFFFFFCKIVRYFWISACMCLEVWSTF